jgi:hypothetical protein
MDSVNERDAVVVASCGDLENMMVAVVDVGVGNTAGTGMVNERGDIEEDIVGEATRDEGFLFLTSVAHHYMCNFFPVVCVWGPLASYERQIHDKAKKALRVRAIAATLKLDSNPLDHGLPMV